MIFLNVNVGLFSRKTKILFLFVMTQSTFLEIRVYQLYCSEKFICMLEILLLDVYLNGLFVLVKLHVV